MDYLKTIKLGLGKGKPDQQACWMTALQAHIGGEWTDQCSCVDPTINLLCIKINDLYGHSDQARTEDILEFGLFEPLGTKDEENAEKRKYFLIDRSIRYWHPLRLRMLGSVGVAEELEKLSPIVDRETAYLSYKQFKKSDISACYNIDYSVSAAFVVCGDACAASEYYAALDIYAARREFIKQHIFPVLRQLIDMGKHGPYEQEPVCGVEKFRELVGIK